MRQLRVDPGALDDASTVIRGGYDDGAVQLARAVVRDLLDGAGDVGSGDLSAVFGTALPLLVDLISQHGATASCGLSDAADDYRQADRLHRPVPGVRR